MLLGEIPSPKIGHMLRHQIGNGGIGYLRGSSPNSLEFFLLDDLGRLHEGSCLVPALGALANVLAPEAEPHPPDLALLGDAVAGVCGLVEVHSSPQTMVGSL